MSSHASQDALGQVVANRYRLIAKIGTGPSATVYLADDVRLRRRVVVKLLAESLAAEASFVDRFGTDMQAAAALRHPHIGAVYDWGIDGVPFVVGEYFSSGDLKSLLDRGVTLSPSQALQLGLSVARGLAHAHGRGVVHRDLKPSNLLFGGDGRPRIVDFGLTRALAEAASTRPMGVEFGGVRYASPEQARGRRIDVRADVYALGLILIEAVTGSVPFASDTAIATLMGRVEAAPTIPPALGALAGPIARATTIDPDERLDAQGLVTALMAVADGFDDPEPLELEGERAGAVIDAPLEPFDDITLVVPSAPVHDPSTEEAEPAPLGPISEEGSDLVGPTTPVDAGSDVGERAEATEPSGGPTPSATTRGRRRWRIAWVSLVVVLLVGGAAVGLLVWRAHRVPTHVVPSVAGLDASTARTRLEHLGFIVDTRHIRRDGTHAGELVGVSPPAGTRLAEGKTVTLEVSDGQTLVTVPNALIGLGEDTARSRLDGLGLAIGSVSKRYSETVPAGRVLSTEPAAGAEVEKGGPVGLVVSDGPEPRVVPSVSGMSPERAEAALRSIGLVPVVVERFDTKVDTGGLIGVEPAPGASVPRGASVQVVVSKGLLVAVPSLSGITTVSGAISALQSVGLVANSLEGSGSLSGRPVAFNPPAGQLVAKGSRVDIVVQ